MLSTLSPWGVTAGAAVGSAVASAVEQLASTFSFDEALQTASNANVEHATVDIDQLAALREQARSKRSNLQSTIAQHLQAAGIELDSPLNLQVDAFGDLRVASGHSESSRIEWLLNNDQPLRNQWSELGSLETEIQRHELGQRADRLESLDPHAASALRSRTLRHKADPLRLSIHE